MSDPSYGPGTRLVHVGEPHPRILGAVSMPVFQTSMYEYAGEEAYEDLKYIRLNNTPNHRVLGEKIASLENAEAALVSSSGMAAISAVLLSVLSAGDHLVAQDTLYGGTHSLLTQDLPAMGIAVSFVRGDAPAEWERHLTPATKAFFCEAMTNPLLQVADLEGILGFCRDHGLVSIIDNTFPSPINFRAVEKGFDYSIHSCTKYLNGHSDIVAGAILGSKERVNAALLKQNHLGGSLDPHACFLLHRGLKTLALRMAQHNRSALEIARFFAVHPKVERVHYPGLETHPDHERAKSLFSGYSGMMALELEGGVGEAQRFFSKLKLPVVAPSLGGVETLITRPATASHSGLSPEERAEIGISDRLIRLSVGIEETEDLIADFAQAME